jgi:hypothetical protein
MAKKNKKPLNVIVVEHEEEITFVCPKKGKITQKIKVKKITRPAENHDVKSSDIEEFLEEHPEELEEIEDV